MVPATATMMMWLLHTCNHVISVKQEQVGIEECKRQCARYNKCYGIEYNKTTVTCRILNNRHTDGDALLLSRRDILQSTSLRHLDIAPPRYESLHRIVSKKGHAVDIPDQLQSEKLIYVWKIFNYSSLHNCEVVGESFGSLTHSDLHAPVCTGMSRAFIPGKNYLTAFLITYQKMASQLVFTFAFSNTQTFHANGTNWNITYVHDSLNGRLVANFYGPGSHMSKNIYNRGRGTSYFLAVFVDRSLSGDVLHDMVYSQHTIRGSIKGLNLNQPVWLAVQVHSPNTVLSPTPNLHGGTNWSARKSVHQWYKKPNI